MEPDIYAKPVGEEGRYVELTLFRHKVLLSVEEAGNLSVLLQDCLKFAGKVCAKRLED